MNPTADGAGRSSAVATAATTSPTTIASSALSSTAVRAWATAGPSTRAVRTRRSASGSCSRAACAMRGPKVMRKIVRIAHTR